MYEDLRDFPRGVATPNLPGAPLLAAKGISKRFGGITALDSVSIDLLSGEIHSLMGENGAGKSTLMKILSGVYTDYEGAIEIDGRQMRFASVREAEAAGVAIIHQELNLVPELTVAENMFLGREPLIAGLFVDRKSCVREARRLLARLGIELDPEARISSLRIGEQQLVEIAKALSLNARILIMDEPTSALSPGECERLFAIMRQLAASGVGVIYISHRIDEVMQLSDRTTVFRDGRHVWTRAMTEIDEDRIISAMVGRNLNRPDNVRDASAVRAPVLSVRGLGLSVSDRRGWKQVLKGVTFDVAAGEILGIGGLLGAGRTEILQAITGAREGQVDGQILIEGKPVSVTSPVDARRLGIGYVTEDRKGQGLHLNDTILDNVALPLVGRLARFGVRDFAGEEALAADAVRTLGIRASGTKQVAGTLSGGNQQKVVIGKCLAANPRILLLDEPTRGIDVGAKSEIYELIFRLAGEGMAIVVVSSEMPELLHLADRILVMSEGRQTGVLDRAMANEERIMQLAAPRALKRQEKVTA
ncbi:sugar ABC transporter ATP-binding protein [Rhizobium leguminosarum]|uniref:Sugar ABC transporter ATP-binding protein n=1 Tax=Rhizobium leguminosarum TaxID=384 RepID=A0AAJ1AA77_RHILE|nr:sugar ABC transporter ATP-binding protein [Rhizobium leguminosarum]MBY5535527.1 sugar ABC transporter ATP-binding protein [Rhizobium leguminosarum]MBY5596631.1 sugar ABC transporter ATP-binding protein [Rhizobium leguminosarum]MBY5616024.1 sugar ABC transporter ATP-binding protein [Rhizobium leguminosarum]MBY5629926.1 sugar ABC transporter ATP-binding protein [Rhizobium leguminosarum]MBY5731056.1 sugar ABC transporter ATP-binding protein [Rhizobium leguminosarum]